MIKTNRLITFLVLSIGLCIASNVYAESGLDLIRERLRAEAGLATPSDKSKQDIPLVGFTVLPGDTYSRLASDLTGSSSNAATLKKIAPGIKPGEKIHVPRALLRSSLSDTSQRLLKQGRDFTTLWSLVKTGHGVTRDEIGPMVRVVQRLNNITDTSRIARGQVLTVPESLFPYTGVALKSAPAIRIRSDYRVTNLKGLSRTPQSGQFPSSLKKRLMKRGEWSRQLNKRDTDLVVIHTTEHGRAGFSNVARYLKKKRLANYLIGPDGSVWEIVPDKYRAYGAGPSLWEGLYQIDYSTINVEIYANTDPGSDYTSINDAQYRGLKGLLANLKSRYPKLHAGRIVTHRMIALSYKTWWRSRKGDPYEFAWAKAGLPDNSVVIDQDVLVGRAILCTDERYADRVTKGQTVAARMRKKM